MQRRGPHLPVNGELVRIPYEPRHIVREIRRVVVFAHVEGGGLARGEVHRHGHVHVALPGILGGCRHIECFLGCERIRAPLDLTLVVHAIAVRVRFEGIGMGARRFLAVGQSVAIRVGGQRVRADLPLVQVRQPVTIRILIAIRHAIAIAIGAGGVRACSDGFDRIGQSVTVGVAIAAEHHVQYIGHTVIVAVDG